MVVNTGEPFPWPFVSLSTPKPTQLLRFALGVPLGDLGDVGSPTVMVGGVVCRGIDSKGALGSIPSAWPFVAMLAEGRVGLKWMNRGGGVLGGDELCRLCELLAPGELGLSPLFEATGLEWEERFDRTSGSSMTIGLGDIERKAEGEGDLERRPWDPVSDRLCGRLIDTELRLPRPLPPGLGGRGIEAVYPRSPPSPS
jgi:hypothetical protein